VSLENFYSQADSPDFVERTQYVDIQTYLPDDLLVKVDIATMIHSLGRSLPDHELAEFAARLRGGGSCAPTEIYPQEGWGTFRQINRREAGVRHAGRAVVRNAAAGSPCRPARPRSLQRGLFDGDAVRSLLDEHVAGRANYGDRIWELLCLELWHRSYIDRPRAELTGPAEAIL
jgi:asparagine synthase (glutamine-hydrolysing)